jgi:cell shape-determining protein MreC
LCRRDRRGADDRHRREADMRKLIVGALVLFIAYFLVTNPEGAASIVESAWDAIVSFFESVLDFISALFS